MGSMSSWLWLKRVCEYRRKKPQIPPLRCAPVGMTKKLSRVRWYPTQAKTGLEWGTQRLLTMKQSKKSHNLGMTIRSPCKSFSENYLTLQQSCHPDRSALQWRDLRFLFAGSNTPS